MMASAELFETSITSSNMIPLPLQYGAPSASLELTARVANDELVNGSETLDAGTQRELPSDLTIPHHENAMMQPAELMMLTSSVENAPLPLQCEARLF